MSGMRIHLSENNQDSMKRAKIYPKISADSIHRLSRFIRSIESTHMIHRADCLFSPSSNSTRGLSPCAISPSLRTTSSFPTDCQSAPYGLHFLRYAAILLLLMVVGVSGVWGQSLPFDVTTENDVTNHTEKLYWMESVGATGFYAVPHSNNQNASTTNVPTLRALWYFMTSGEDGYYYIINKETGKYLKKTGNTGTDNTIGVADYAIADDVKFKFSFGTLEGITEDSWVIYPKEAGTAGWLSKKSGNLQYNLWLKVSNWNNTPVGDLNSQWKIVPRANVQWPKSGLPFVVSTSSDKHYYRINHAQNTDYNISYDDSNFAIISSDNDNKIAWYFEEAASDPNIDNLKYYYIVNVESGKYLKFTSTDQNINGNNQDNKVFSLLDYNAGDADRFQFVVVNSYGGNAGYSIMPKLAMSKYDVNSYANSMISSSVSNNDKLDLRSDRNNNNAHWTFKALWADPVVTCDENGTITITGEDGATFYYTTDGSTVPTTGNTQYNANNKPTVSEGITTIQVRAIATGKSDSRVITQKIVYLPNQTFDSSTYDGTAQTPVVKVGETTISSDEFNVSYKLGGNDVTECKDAGTYTVEITDNNGGEYIVYGSGSFTINSKPLTITANNKAITYGDAPTNDGVTYGEFATGDNENNLTGTLDYTYNYEQYGNVGNYTITPSGLTSDNYNITFAPGTLTVNPKAVTVTSGITAEDKTYDGTTAATLVCTNAVFEGRIGSDDLTIVSAMGTFNNKNVGANKPVSITGLTFGGAAAGNYTLAESGNQSYITASISAKDITASGTITASNKVYDGTTTAVFDYSGVTLTGKVEGDALSYTATGAFADKNVGTGKSINITSQSLSGADVGNYNLASSNVSATTTADITAAEITVSGITAENKVYNSTTTATLDFSGVILTGKVEGDDLSITATGTFADANVGTGKTVTISGLTLEGTDAGNYELAASGQQTEVTADITAKAVTITANNASRDYNGNPLTEAGFTATALEEGDTHTFTVTMTAESTITNAGTQPNVIATVDGVAVTTGNATEVGNYLVTTVDGTLTINGTAITISVNLNDWIYGSPNNPSVTGNTGGGAVTYSYKLQTEDNSKYKADKPVKVGNYTVKAEVAATATTPAATATKDFTISKAPLVINANPIQKDYLDEDPELTYTVSGLKNNDIEYYVLTCKLQRAAGEEKGTYAITKESHNLKSGNYEAPSFEGATFTINKKNIGDGETIAPGIGIYAKKTGETTWDVSLSNGKNKFNSDNDYEIPVVTGPDEDGNYTITVTGKGNNCEGTAKATYSGATFYDIKDTNEKLTPYLSSTSDLTTSADLVPYIVAQINPTIGTLSVIPVSYIPKDQPVLLLAPSDVTGITTSTKNPATSAISESLLNNNQLLVAPDVPSDPDDPTSVHGVHVEDTEAYVFYKGEFVLTTAGTITAGKYYLKNPNYQTAASPSTSADPAPARSLAIVKGETTGVIQLTNDEAVEGFNDVWYTIDGQKLDKKPTRKGLYIHNGKKHIVK